MAILDVGVGAGVNLGLIADAGFQTYGVDVSAKMIEVARKRSPYTQYAERDFLSWREPRQFHGIMMKAFIHLFPETIARRIVEKARDILECGGVLFLATTMHDSPSQSWERKSEFKAEARRFRKRWTRDEFNAFLESVPGFEIISEESNVEDALGKKWMNIMLRKVCR